MAHSYGICERTFLTHTEKVIELILAKRDHFIKFPMKCEYDQVAEEFNNATNYFFPGVIGAIDG